MFCIVDGHKDFAHRVYEGESYRAENIKYLKELAEENGHKLVKCNEMIIGHTYTCPYCYVFKYGKNNTDYRKYYLEYYNVTYAIDTSNI